MAAVDRAAIAAGRPGPWLMESGRPGGHPRGHPPLRRRGRCWSCAGPATMAATAGSSPASSRRAGWPVRVASLVAAGAPCAATPPGRRPRGTGRSRPATPQAPRGCRARRRRAVRRRPGPAARRCGARDRSRRSRTAGRRWWRSTCPPASTAPPVRCWVRPPQARLTVTFCRLKPGHLLLPGRACAARPCSPTSASPTRWWRRTTQGLRANGPGLWRDLLPRARPRQPQVPLRPRARGRRAGVRRPGPRASPRERRSGSAPGW